MPLPTIPNDNKPLTVITSIVPKNGQEKAILHSLSEVEKITLKSGYATSYTIYEHRVGTEGGPIVVVATFKNGNAFLAHIKDPEINEDGGKEIQEAWANSIVHTFHSIYISK